MSQETCLNDVLLRREVLNILEKYHLLGWFFYWTPALQEFFYWENNKVTIIIFTLKGESHWKTITELFNWNTLEKIKSRHGWPF